MLPNLYQIIILSIWKQQSKIKAKSRTTTRTNPSNVFDLLFQEEVSMLVRHHPRTNFNKNWVRGVMLQKPYNLHLLTLQVLKSRKRQLLPFRSTGIRNLLKKHLWRTNLQWKRPPSQRQVNPNPNLANLNLIWFKKEKNGCRSSKTL